ncbi:MAG TPA: hypothetical protein VNZ86_01580, partial [Bacteroidia bacterium]|nr:hypothetical protein [Bacteroidia bacterium]
MKKGLIASIMLCLSLLSVRAQNITTIAGNGTEAYSGDGGTATSAELFLDFSAGAPNIAVDGAGNVYIADVGNNRIRMVNTSGTISTIAGTGTAGFSGDGGPATAAELNAPCSVAVDHLGNVYISDQGNNRIRKISGTTITTIAGNGTSGYNGDGIPATTAELNYPQGIAVDASLNVYIADYNNSRIRLVSGTTITTIAGNGTSGFSGDGGPATSAQLSYPISVALSSSGSAIYIADYDNNRIREIVSGTINTIAGNGTAGFSGDWGTATAAELNSPCGVTVDNSGNVFIADLNNHRIREVTGGVIKTTVGTGVAGYSGDGGPAISAEMYGPYGLAVDASGSLFIADYARVRKLFLPSGTVAEPAPVNPEAVTIFPVPSRGEFTVSTHQTGYSRIIIYDGQGRVVDDRALDGSNTNQTIPFSLDLPNGNYWM